MDPITVSFIALGLMILMLCTGIPVAMAIAVAAVGGFFALQGVDGILFAAAAPWQHAFSFNLIALPLFIMMGYILENAGITQGLFRFVSNCVGRIPGSLGIAALLACGIFSAVSGSGSAATATMASICYPYLERYRYSRRLTAGLLAAGGSLDPVIPPSGALILYGVLTGQSVAKLYAAAMLPGILVLGAMMGYMSVVAIANPAAAPKPPKVSFHEKVSSTLFLLPFLLLMVLVLGTIYLGWATPTESAALGVFGAFALMIIYRRLNWKAIKEATRQTVLTGAFVLFIVTFALMLGDLFMYVGLPQWLAKEVSGWGLPYWGVFGCLIAIYLVMGMFLDPPSIIVLTVPLVAPVLEILGFDLILFGVVLVILTEIGTMTPPFALHVFIVQGITKISYEDCVMGALPFVIIWVLVVLFIVAFPSVATWLPGLLY